MGKPPQIFVSSLSFLSRYSSAYFILMCVLLVSRGTSKTYSTYVSVMATAVVYEYVVYTIINA
jgi:hypothetical protein